jgi:hypothetical protein
MRIDFDLCLIYLGPIFFKEIIYNNVSVMFTITKEVQPKTLTTSLGLSFV